MITSSKIISLYFLLMSLCVGCSYVQVKSPSQLIIDKTSNNSLILLRVAADINNKPIDISEPPIFGGYANPYTLTISNLVTGDAPEIIYPGSDKANAPSEQMKKQGWIYFYAAPGDYELNVKTFRFNSGFTNPAILLKHFVIHVGQDSKIIYGGSFVSKCDESEYWMLANCDAVDAPIDETQAALEIAQTFFADTKPFVTELLQPLNANWTIADLQPIGLVIQRNDELYTPPWVRRGMSRFTGIGDPGKAYNPPSPNFSGGGCGQACAGILMLYLMYLPVGALIGAGYGEYTEAKWQPCISSLQQELAHYDFPTKLGDAIIQTIPTKNSPVAFNISNAKNPTEEASRLGLKTIIKADIQRIQLRECAKDGTFCMEFAMHFTVNDIKSGQVLFGKTMIYSESEASIQDRPYEVRTQKSPSCYVMNAYCGNDKIVFQSQIKEAMDILAHEMLNTLKDKKDKTEKDN